MEVILRRISYAKYDGFIEANIDHFASLSKEDFEKNYDYVLEDICIDGETVLVNIDVEEMINIYNNVIEFNEYNPMEAIDIRYAELLYKALSVDTNIPKYVLYEKEVWAYLNCFILLDVVKKRFFADEGSFLNKGRIMRVVFCDESVIDRTGLRWLWALADATYSDTYGFSLMSTARQFIDPVKALYERVMGTNRMVFQAYVRAIQLLEYDLRIKSEKFRSLLPTHIRNLATMKIYESYNSVEDLAVVIASDIKDFLDNYKDN